MSAVATFCQCFCKLHRASLYSSNNDGPARQIPNRPRRAIRPCAADTVYGSVLVRIEFVRSGHRDTHGRESVQNSHRVADRLKHLIEALVAIGRLIESGTPQFNSRTIHPLAHHLRRNLAGTLDLASLAVDHASR